MLIAEIAIVLLLIVLNGFFAMAEIALVSARPARLQQVAERGNAGAQAAIELKSDPSRLLSTIQIGITLIAVLSGTFGEATLGSRLEQALAAVPGVVGEYAHAISMATVVLGISYLSLILGELVPKRLALANPERLASGLGRIMRTVSRLGAPLARVLSASSDLVLRLAPGIREASPAVTDEEITFMLREGVAAGHIPHGETAIVEMALRLGDRRVSAVMTPRTRIEWLDLDDPEAEIRRKIRESPYSRFPVMQGGSQQVLGTLQVKDLLGACLAGEPFNPRAALRSPLFLPNTVNVLRALEVFKTSREPIALIVDEYGDLEGLVTLNDILQALVGDIPGEDADRRVVRREDGSWLLDGMLGLDELKQVLRVSHLPGEEAGDFHTLGGYLMARIKRVPMVADRVTVGAYRFEVVEMDGRRVHRVLVTPAKGRAGR